MRVETTFFPAIKFTNMVKGNILDDNIRFGVEANNSY